MQKLRTIAVMALLSMLGFAFNATAQTAADVEATVKKMMAASTPCNQGPEAFKDFIAKFSTDKDFMESRIKLSADQRAKFADLLVPSNFTAKTPFAKDGDEYCQTWGELQFGKAYLECGWVDSYVTHIFEFVRDGGKWYLGKVVVEED